MAKTRIELLTEIATAIIKKLEGSSLYVHPPQIAEQADKILRCLEELNSK